MSAELKPRPFCGSEEVTSNMSRASGQFWYECEQCGVESGGTLTHDQAIAAWNQRTDLAPTLAVATYEIAPLQEICAIIGTATPAQSDKIAEAADGSSAVKIEDVAQYLLDHMPPYNSEHPCWEALQDANDDGADEDDCIRAWLRALAGKGE